MRIGFAIGVAGLIVALALATISAAFAAASMAVSCLGFGSALVFQGQQEQSRTLLERLNDVIRR